jgi:DNA-binding HxlR family transcriptional regulator
LQAISDKRNNGYYNNKYTKTRAEYFMTDKGESHFPIEDRMPLWRDENMAA